MALTVVPGKPVGMPGFLILWQLDTVIDILAVPAGPLIRSALRAGTRMRRYFCAAVCAIFRSGSPRHDLEGFQAR